ncbi:MAG: hypothetical protein HOC72_27685 [Rhodospirillaceae bacterium]|jgi:hypothetical protein|nr:hypothetical protein [Rhodospirillaceae bacterium]
MSQVQVLPGAPTACYENARERVITTFRETELIASSLQPLLRHIHYGKSVLFSIWLKTEFGDYQMGFILNDTQGNLISGGLNTLFNPQNIDATKAKIEERRKTFSQLAKNAERAGRDHMHHNSLRFAGVILHDILEVDRHAREPVYMEPQNVNLYRAWLKYLNWADGKGKKAQDLMKEIEIALEPNPPKPIYFEWKEDARTNWFDFTASDCEIGGVAHRCIQVTSSPSHVLPKDRNYDEEWP